MKFKGLKQLTGALACCGVLLVGNTAFADEAGWQKIATQKYTVDNLTTTSPVALDGGGVKVCFSGVDYKYSVKLSENDLYNPDEHFATKTLSGDSCLTWSDVNSESGQEELYLTFTKFDVFDDSITITWYD